MSEVSCSASFLELYSSRNDLRKMNHRAQKKTLIYQQIVFTRQLFPYIRSPYNFAVSFSSSLFALTFISIFFFLFFCFVAVVLKLMNEFVTRGVGNRLGPYLHLTVFKLLLMLFLQFFPVYVFFQLGYVIWFWILLRKSHTSQLFPLSSNSTTNADKYSS